MLDQTVQEVATGSRVKKDMAAFHLAEAGIDYAAWKLYNFQAPTLPVTWTRGNLGTGTFSVTADKFNGSSTILAVSSDGTSQGYTSQVKVIGSFLTAGGGGSQQNAVFNSALFSNTDLSMNGNFTVTGDTFSNGNTTMNGNASISGDVGSVGTIKTNGNSHIGGARKPAAAKISMPVIDTAHYQNAATQTYSSGKSFNGNIALNGVVYVNGNCSINGNFSGKGLIVATGKVTINGNAGWSTQTEMTLSPSSPAGVSRSMGTAPSRGGSTRTAPTSTVLTASPGTVTLPSPAALRPTSSV